MNVHLVAKQMAGGGKVLTSEARTLASEYLHLEDAYRKALAKIQELDGGERVKHTPRNGDLFKDGHIRIGSPTQPNGVMARPLRNGDVDINRLLAAALNVDVTPFGYDESITGTPRNAQFFARLSRVIDDAIQTAYDTGYEQGGQLLVRLAQGEVGATEYDRLTGGR